MGRDPFCLLRKTHLSPTRWKLAAMGGFGEQPATTSTPRGREPRECFPKTSSRHWRTALLYTYTSAPATRLTRRHNEAYLKSMAAALSSATVFLMHATATGQLCLHRSGPNGEQPPSAARVTRHRLTPLSQGFQMAKNLQAKLLPTDSLSLFDINREVMQTLAADMETASTEGASVALAPSAADASQDAVCMHSSLSPLPFRMMRNIFSVTQSMI